MKKNLLLIPSYLNQRIVFDLIAMLQDGLSTVTKISETEASRDQDQRRYGAAFGLSQAFSTLLKIDLSGQSVKSGEDALQTSKSEERVHTPASLLYKLRNQLLETQHLIIVDANFIPNSGDLIEFSTKLNRNPLIQTMDAFIKFGNLVRTFAEATSEPNKPQKSIKNRNYISKTDNVLKQMEEFRRELKSGDTTDILSEKLVFGYKAVITLENEFLNDPSMSDLVDGSYNVIGKIISVIPGGEGNISLIRKTALSIMPSQVLKATFGHLTLLNTVKGYGLPNLEWEVQGPALHIIPLAIFA